MMYSEELLASLDASVMQTLGLGADHLEQLMSRMHLAGIGWRNHDHVLSSLQAAPQFHKPWQEEDKGRG